MWGTGGLTIRYGMEILSLAQVQPAFETLGFGQDYSLPITLGAGMTMTDNNTVSAKPIIFNSTVDGDFNLTVTDTDGIQINGDIGSLTPLNNLNIDSAVTLHSGYVLQLQPPALLMAAKRMNKLLL